jgi:hypothetical protein
MESEDDGTYSVVHPDRDEPPTRQFVHRLSAHDQTVPPSALAQGRRREDSLLDQLLDLSLRVVQLDGIGVLLRPGGLAREDQSIQLVPHDQLGVLLESIPSVRTSEVDESDSP